MTTTHEPGGAPLDMGTLISETIDDLTKNLVPYALASLGATVVMMPVAIVLVLVLTFVFPAAMMVLVGVGMAASETIADPGAALAARVLTLLGGGAAGLAGFALLIGGMGALFAPMTASVQRAVAAHQRGEGTLDFMSAFQTWSQDVVALVVVSAVVVGGAMFGLPFCYVGYFVPLFLWGFASLLVALHRRGAMDALRTSARHALAYPRDHAVFLAVWFASLMISGYIPVIGTAFVWALQVRAYRKLFGDGPEPVV